MLEILPFIPLERSSYLAIIPMHLFLAIEKALAYHDLGELPKGWNILDTIDEKEESSDDDTPAPLVPNLSPDARAFQENIYSFMSKRGKWSFLEGIIYVVKSTDLSLRNIEMCCKYSVALL